MKAVFNCPGPTGFKPLPDTSFTAVSVAFAIVQSLQSCPTRWDPRDCSPPGSSVHGIFQARILEWGAISFSRASSQHRNQTCVSCIAGGLFTAEPPGKPVFKRCLGKTDAEEAEAEWFYEDLQDLLELTRKTDVLFIIGAGMQE